MCEAAEGGHIEIVKLCKECGATNYDETMWHAAFGGHIEIVKLCKEWGATNYYEVMRSAAWTGDIEIGMLCRDYLGFAAIHNELLRQHHKRKFYRKIHNDLLPVACHPDRVWDWCFDEEQKGRWKCQ